MGTFSVNSAITVFAAWVCCSPRLKVGVDSCPGMLQPLSHRNVAKEIAIIEKGIILFLLCFGVVCMTLTFSSFRK